MFSAMQRSEIGLLQKYIRYRTLKEVTKRMLSDENLNGDDLDSTKK